MITVLVAYTEAFDRVAYVTVPILHNYCQRHGYDLLIHRGGFGDRLQQFGFQKTALVRQVLRGTDAMFVLDVDTLITNLTIKLESFMGEELMYACNDENGLNAGSYIIRKNAYSDIFLGGVLKMEGAEGVLGEQDAMRDILKAEMFPFLKILPHPAINSYRYDEYGKTKTHEEGQWQQGDFLLHLPGMTNDRREEIFRSTVITQ